jgi:hypothetical protein
MWRRSDVWYMLVQVLFINLIHRYILLLTRIIDLNMHQNHGAFKFTTSFA